MNRLCLIAAALCITFGAHANELQKPCSREDFVMISLALNGKNTTVVHGVALKSQVWTILTAEQNVNCVRISNHGSSDYFSALYEVGSGSQKFGIQVGTQGSDWDLKTVVSLTTIE